MAVLYMCILLVSWPLPQRRCVLCCVPVDLWVRRGTSVHYDCCYLVNNSLHGHAWEFLKRRISFSALWNINLRRPHHSTDHLTFFFSSFFVFLVSFFFFFFFFFFECCVSVCKGFPLRSCVRWLLPLYGLINALWRSAVRPSLIAVQISWFFSYLCLGLFLVSHSSFSLLPYSPSPTPPPPTHRPLLSLSGLSAPPPPFPSFLPPPPPPPSSRSLSHSSVFLFPLIFLPPLPSLSPSPFSLSLPHFSPSPFSLSFPLLSPPPRSFFYFFRGRGTARCTEQL